MKPHLGPPHKRICAPRSKTSTSHARRCDAAPRQWITTSTLPASSFPGSKPGESDLPELIQQYVFVHLFHPPKMRCMPTGYKALL